MRYLLTGLLGLVLGGSAAAQFHASQLRPWTDVEAVQEAPGTLKYSGQMFASWLAPDGRLATVIEPPDEMFEDRPPMPATLGTWRNEGAWLVLEGTHFAFRDPAELEKLRARMEEQFAEMAKDANDEEELAQIEAARAQFDAPLDEDDLPKEVQRFLRVPFGGGELLLMEWSVKSTAAGWDGKGPLQVYPVAWRLPEAATIGTGDLATSFAIPNPLSAGLPIELTALLRRDTITGQVVEILETPDTLKWAHNTAEVQVKLDRGANHGLYQDMDLYGLPPDESFFAQVSEVKGEEAIATLHVSRFAPKDAVELPVRGLRFTTRREGKQACRIDNSAAVRGKVLALAADPARAEFVDSYAYVELEIDQGMKHGLFAGDRLQAEDDEIDGEGRVERVQDERATVLWRVGRYSDDERMRWPAAGEALVTPAWRREAEDAFGSLGKE